MKLSYKILVTFSVLAVFVIGVPCLATTLYSEDFEGSPGGGEAMNTLGWTYGIAGANGSVWFGRNGTRVSIGGQFLSHPMDAAPNGNEILSISGDIDVAWSTAGDNHSAVGISDIDAASGDASWFGGTPDVYPGIGAMLWRPSGAETKLVVWRPLTLGGGFAEAVVPGAPELGTVKIELNTATGLADGYFDGVKLITGFDMTGSLTAAQFSTEIQNYTHFLGKWRTAAQMDNFLVESSVIPEPATMALLAAGLIGIRRRRKL